jgi:TPR repeat protein
MYEKGKGVRKSNPKALKYYGKACDLELVLGCKNYAKLKK